MNTESKVATLFSYISQNSNMPLTSIFEKFSKKWKLSRDSVRNIYYQNFEKVSKDQNFCSECKIQSSNLKKSSIFVFDEKEKEWLIKNILLQISEGNSVRKACLNIAKGDATNMIRYLNKYRSILKKEPEYIDKISKKYEITYKNTFQEKNQTRKIQKKDKGITILNPNGEETGSNETISVEKKLIKMPEKPDIISDKDIQSLFMGLVRLVKNNTIKEVDYAFNQKYKEQINEIYILRKNLKMIKNELQEEKRHSSRLQLELNLLKNGKAQEYINFMKNMKNDNSNEQETN